MASELLARTTVHKGRIIQVEIDVVKLPSGHTFSFSTAIQAGEM